MKVELSERELATVLAALRNWQADALNEDLVEIFAGHFEDHEPLSDDEIDELCERLNFGEVAGGEGSGALSAATGASKEARNDGNRG